MADKWRNGKPTPRPPKIASGPVTRSSRKKREQTKNADKDKDGVESSSSEESVGPKKQVSKAKSKGPQARSPRKPTRKQGNVPQTEHQSERRASEAMPTDTPQAQTELEPVRVGPPKGKLFSFRRFLLSLIQCAVLPTSNSTAKPASKPRPNLPRSIRDDDDGPIPTPSDQPPSHTAPQVTAQSPPPSEARNAEPQQSTHDAPQPSADDAPRRSPDDTRQHSPQDTPRQLPDDPPLLRSARDTPHPPSPVPMPPVRRQYVSQRKRPAPLPEIDLDTFQLPSPPRPVDPKLKAVRKTMHKATLLANAMFDDAFPDSLFSPRPPLALEENNLTGE